MASNSENMTISEDEHNSTELFVIEIERVVEKTERKRGDHEEIFNNLGQDKLDHERFNENSLKI